MTAPLTYTRFELELCLLFDYVRGIRDTRPWHEQPYWKDIQMLKQLAYFEVTAALSNGEMP